jgi:hypothetical protein
VVFFFLPVMKIEVLTNSVSDTYIVSPCTEGSPELYTFQPLGPDQVDYALSEQLRERNTFDIALVSAALIGFVLLAIILLAIVAAQQVLQAARVPIIRLQRTGAAPELPLAKGHTRHLFLSQ